MAYQPKTGAACGCKRGIERDNCANCEGTGRVIGFAAIRARNKPGIPCSNMKEFDAIMDGDL
jgi:hypothetical protein